MDAVIQVRGAPVPAQPVTASACRRTAALPRLLSSPLALQRCGAASSSLFAGSRGRDRACLVVRGAFSGAPRDPFATSSGSTPVIKPAEVEGFLAPGGDRAALMPVEEAHALLKAFNQFQLQGKEEVSGLYAKPGCTEEQQTEARGKLRAACVALAAASERVMLGVCGPTQGAGVDALKGWVPALGLPKGRLHGMDKAGVPIDMAGAVFIKYNSISGDADLSGYGGLYRGVLFTPQLPDGEFRQYGYLPLGLFQP